MKEKGGKMPWEFQQERNGVQVGMGSKRVCDPRTEQIRPRRGSGLALVVPVELEPLIELD